MKKTILPFICAVLFAFPMMGQHFFGEPQEEFFGINLSEPNTPITSPCLADLDADGDLDLLVAKVWYNNTIPQTWNLNYYENIGTAECPEFAGPVANPFGIPDEPLLYLTLVDIDSDGDLDLFAGGSFLRNEQTGSVPDFSQSTFNHFPFGLVTSGIGAANLAFGDLNGDGLLDAFVCGRTNDHFYVQLNTGTATAPWFAPRITDPFGLEFGEHANGPSCVSLADWDCDGDLDVLNSIWHIDLPPWPSLIFVTYLHKNLTVEEDTLLFSEGQLLEDSLYIMTHGDMDGDGDLDVLSFNYFIQNISPNCVTLPEPAFTAQQVGLEWEFTNTSSYQETACNPVKFLWDFGDGTTSEEESPIHTFPADGEYTICLEMEDVAGWSEEPFCELILGAREKWLQKAFTIAPNPATDYLQLTFHSGQSFEALLIFDALGRQVWVDETGDFYNGDTRYIDLTALPAGMYSLLLRQDGVMAGKPFVVVK